MDPDLYDDIVDACLPELRHEIRKLDGRTGRAMRRKKAREIDIENIESVASADFGSTLDYIAEINRIVGRVGAREQRMIILRGQGYKFREIAEILDIPLQTAASFFKRVRNKVNKNG